MKNTTLIFGLILGLLIFCQSHALLGQDQQELGKSLFQGVEKALIQAQSEQANVLSPSNFNKAMEKYNQAMKEFKEGKELKEIKKKIAEAQNYLNKALDTTKLGKITFATSLEARDDALKANAPQYAKESYEEAENAFIDAAEKLEEGNVKEAKKKVPDIDSKYRAAELTAIKVNIIGTVRNLMQEAKKAEANKYTPITYAKAQKLQSEAEAILNSNRRSETSAQEKAEAAETEARHAIYLTRLIKQLKDDQKQWENFFLNRESSVENIALALGFTATFDEGLEKPLRKIQAAVKNLQKEHKDLLAELTDKNKELDRLNSQLMSYKEQQQGLQAELQDKQMRLELKKQREEKITAIEQMFSSSEAVVLRKSNDIIIRLIGLTFSSGKSVIEPEYFSILSKVQRAIRKFNNVAITIEGHTDSIGDDRYNENLSYERALAVKKYLIANMGLDESRITAVGYGESRPIASNDTKEGRAQNRRIDVVLTFTDEIM